MREAIFHPLPRCPIPGRRGLPARSLAGLLAAAVVLGTGGGAGYARAGDAAPTPVRIGDPAIPAASLADCDAAAPATVLRAGDPALVEAEAIWLDADTLRWPGKGPGARLRLVSTPEVFKTLAVGQRIGADPAHGWRLQPVEPSAAPPRLPWAGEGVDWDVGASEAWRTGAAFAGDLVLLEVDVQDRVLDATRVQHAAALDERYAAAAAIDDFGVRPGDDGSAFRLWAPTAAAVSVCVYPDDAAAATALAPLARDDATGAWSGTVPQARRGGYYTYLVEVFVPGTGRVRNRVTDPYAVSLGADSKRAWIGDLDDPATKPAGWDTAPRGRDLAAATDAMLYELHVRDFSIADDSVPAAHRGKYLAFAAPDSDGTAHLRRLAGAGMTDVHLLPVYDFGSVPEVGCVTPAIPAGGGVEAAQAAVAAVKERDCFNWGYDPVHYTAPEGSYATDPHDGAARVREFRTMVMALHAAGLRVGMDVVYNHTFASGQKDKSVLDRIVPGYYHRLDAKGAVAQSTCCDNTATENTMMAKLMIDSAATWARAYRIDSFRFDLMGHQPRAAMERLQRAVDAAAGRHLLLIGEGWNFGEIADGRRFVQASQLSLGGSGIGTFSDRARDAVRGGGCCDSGTALAANQGWANGLHHAPNRFNKTTPYQLQRAADLLRVGLAGTLRDVELVTYDGSTKRLDAIDYAGQPAGYAHAPGEVVNYVENHDNLTLFDANALKLPAGTPAAERARVQVLALATVAFSQGIAYFHAGAEILRSKSLDRNSFNSGDAFNRIDWSLAGNGFGTGLPPAEDNGSSWEVMRAVLADPSVPPSPAEIGWTRDAFLDLLRIRSASPLLRLADAAEVRRRLHFAPAGPEADGTVVGAWLDGEGLAGAGARRLAYFINAGATAATVRVPALAGLSFELHPVHTADEAADLRPRTARYDAADGAFRVPARTAVVFVAP